MKSKLLVHPLAESAGGDFYHSGGKQFLSQSDLEWQTLKAFVLGQATPVAAHNPGQRKPRIIQTNAGGDNVHVIDPVTNRVVGTITGIEANHGVAVAPDGSRIYISNEAESSLDVADSTTFKVIGACAVERAPEQHRCWQRRTPRVRRDYSGTWRR